MTAHIKNTNATPAAFGWDFQYNLALYLVMDQDLTQVEKFKVEGATEDIEIYFRNKEPIYIQAKAQEDPYSTSTTSQHLKNAVNSLIKFLLRDDTNQQIFDSILKFAKKLNVEDYLNSDKNFVFTSDLKSLSGTVLHKIVFCYKMAYIIELQNYLGLTLPIVLDSPSGREVDQKNIEDMFNILNDEFRDNQIIIASIFKYSRFNVDKLIEIKTNLLE